MPTLNHIRFDNVQSRVVLKTARRRYGKFLWNSLARLKSNQERNQLLRTAGQRAVDAGLYAESTGWKMAVSSLLKAAFHSYYKGPRSNDAYANWRERCGYLPYAGGFFPESK